MLTLSRVMVPLMTLDTKIEAFEPFCEIVRSQGPLIRLGLLRVFTTVPDWLMIRSDPAVAVADVPSVLGRLPTTMNRFPRTPSAVLSPVPAAVRANRVADPFGVTLTML